MPRRVFWILLVLVLSLAEVASAQMDPFSLGAGLISQALSRRRARAERRKLARRQRTLKRRVQKILSAVASPERSKRAEGLRSLMTLSREARNGDVRVGSREDIDRTLDRVATSQNPRVRRYAEVIRQNFDLARDPTSQDSRVAAVFERWRSPGA